jgi:hypothetical protein
VQQGGWKLIEWYEDGALELYRIEEDISERMNLVAHEPQRRDELLSLLQDWRNEVGAVLPVPRQ